MINILYTYRTESRHGRKGRDGVVRLQGAALVAVRHKIYMPLLLSVIYHDALVTGRPLTLPSRPCTRPTFHLLVDGSKSSWPHTARGNDFCE